MKLLSVLGLSVLLSTSVQICAQANATESNFETDLDHRVQFKLTKLDGKSYQMEVARLGGVKFDRMNLFATRKAKKICGSLGFSIRYLEGVEGYDDRKFNPNYIFPSLKVKITCP
ncbi:hypothetical protein HII17_10905 [Thalassotalea sp. M1531]|uniref:Uncharacterized protein n=1 Tax=Thalassotalea algicola TaxID=2716224 RepID=A0A7Y0LDA2_9GAMM|nr:hypothetical protein [Thalassotalea algicola]NMP32078.1 hypothetical protein [Thalassotalea algicola]